MSGSGQLARRVSVAVLAWCCLAHATDLRVVTFNTGMGLGSAWRGSAGLEALLVREARRAGPDVFALQEVCLNQAWQLATYLRAMQRAEGKYYHYADYASPELGQECDKGQAIVSALPMLAAGTLRLPKVGAHRSALFVDLGVTGPGFDRVRLYTVHLSNRKGKNLVPVAERAEQLGPLIEHALDFMQSFPGVPVVVAGDFNCIGHLSDPWQREPVVTDMLAYFQASQPTFTRTFVLPYQLDWIFYANLRLERGHVLKAWYSDHLPVVAEFEF